MGFFGDIMDNWFGFNPSNNNAYVYNQQQLAASQAAEAARVQAEQQAAAEAAAAAIPAPAPYTPPAADPGAPVSAFDPTPYRSQVDQGFSQFTPEFYASKYASAFDPYKSGVESQYGLAKDSLTAGLANKGLAQSQQGRGLFQQLDALRDQALNTGQSTAQGFQSSLSDQVGQAKNNLYGSIGEGADNASVGTRAQSEAQRIAGSAAPANTLGDIFGSFVKPYANTKTPGLPSDPSTQAFATGGNLNLANVGGGPAASTKVVNTPTKRRA